jgi:hypothetical protein
MTCCGQGHPLQEPEKDKGEDRCLEQSLGHCRMSRMNISEKEGEEREGVKEGKTEER